MKLVLGGGHLCVAFWYNFRGKGNSTLEMIIRDALHEKSDLTIWHLTVQDEVDKIDWSFGRAYSFNQPTSVNVVFRAQLENSNHPGDFDVIGLDDIQVTYESCSTVPDLAGPISPIPTPKPPPVTDEPPKTDIDCNFENGFCSWQNNGWERLSGQDNPTSGPSHDHTHGQGSFAYLKISETNKTNAKLVSPNITMLPVDRCLVFFYHMWGPDVGGLR